MAGLGFEPVLAPEHLALADRWIFSRLLTTTREVNDALGSFRFHEAADRIYHFFWHEFCDWYLELAKAVLQSATASEAAKRGTRFTLINTLEVLLRALHPLAPFITEEIWQRVRPSAGVAGDTIMRAAYPSRDSVPSDPAAEPEMRWVMAFIEGVRQIRGEMDIAPSRKLQVLLQSAESRDTEYLERNLPYLVRLAGIENPQILTPAQAAPISAVALLGTLEILVPMAGLIDPVAELDRLAKRLRKAQADLHKTQSKLGNAEFVKNAPPEVIAKDQSRLAELRLELGQLAAQTARVTALHSQ